MPITALNSADAKMLADVASQVCRDYPSLLPRTLNPRYWDGVTSGKPWFKSLHVFCPEVAALAVQPNLVAIAEERLGTAVLWGSQFCVRYPGQVHRWHQDIESLYWPCLNAWVALDGIELASSLSILPPGVRPTNETMADYRVDCGPGQAIVFDGSDWHGSINQSSSVRRSLLLQYAPATSNLRIPMTYAEPVRWHPCPPPAIALP